jgi:D-beta-D-heptose 7-phosphate kinase / D-beta-D-heptose 1-phosphate adenosyltransferase
VSRITVIGDVLLDRDVSGQVDRVCPEAPAPVVDEVAVGARPGGAGLAAVLAARMGHEVTLVTALADDEAGADLRALLAQHDVQIVALHDSGSTVEKTRICVDGRPLLRWDRGAAGTAGPLPPEARTAAAGATAALVADYGRATLRGHDVRRWLAAVAASGTPVVWDPHPRGVRPVGRTRLVTPNRSETELFARDLGAAPQGSGLASVAAAARCLRSAWHVGAISVTLGADGALVVQSDGAPLVVPVPRPDHDADTCGAGDAFAAAATAAFASGAVVSEAVAAAVAAAADFVGRGGAAAVSGTAPSRPSVTAEPPARLVATGGCFDVLHPGHVATLQQARRLGDRLVVLVNSDVSVRRLKGPDRPIQRIEDRVAVLEALECVDQVVVFDEDTPALALRALRPAIFVKGGDYAEAHLHETDVMAEWGGTVVTVPFLAGRSTTRIVERIRAATTPRPENPAGTTSGTTSDHDQRSTA